MRAGDAGQRLDRRVGHAEQDAGGGAEHHAVVLDRAAHARAHQQQAADPEQAGLEGDHRALEKCECAPCIAGSVRPSSTRPAGGQRQPDPLAAPDLEAEQPLGHHRDEDHARRQRRPGSTDIGASASAATCRPQLAVAITMPSANHFDEYSCAAPSAADGARSTLGTELAPRYL